MQSVNHAWSRELQCELNSRKYAQDELDLINLIKSYVWPQGWLLADWVTSQKACKDGVKLPHCKICSNMTLWGWLHNHLNGNWVSLRFINISNASEDCVLIKIHRKLPIIPLYIIVLNNIIGSLYHSYTEAVTWYSLLIHSYKNTLLITGRALVRFINIF